MPVNQKLLVGFSPEERRAICAQVEAAYARHVAACASYGTNDADLPIVPADNFEHFCEEFIAVLKVEQVERPAPADLKQIKHCRRDYSEIYKAPLDVSLL